MQLIRLLICGLVGMAYCQGLATPKYKKSFETAMSMKVECTYCHSPKPPKRNAFGKALEDALDLSTDGELTAKMIHSLDAADSDGDGFINGDEISAKTLPGDATSKPVPVGGTATGKADEEKAESELVPKHSFHPALVHFPVALLIVAAVFELVGRKRRDESFHSASVLCNGAGIVGSVLAAISGVIAWLRLGYVLEGTLLIHLVLASLSTIGGIAAYLNRSKPAYVVIITIAAILVGVAGHFGGEMVFG